MTILERYISDIYPSLLDWQQQIDSLTLSINALPGALARQIDELRERILTQKESARATQAQISTYIRIGSGGEQREPSKIGRSETVDFVKLRHLTSTDVTTERGHKLELLDCASAQWRNVQDGITRLDISYQTDKVTLEKKFSNKEKALNRQIQQLRHERSDFLHSNQFRSFLEQVSQVNQHEIDNGAINIGTLCYPFPADTADLNTLAQEWPTLFLNDTATISIAYFLDVTKGGVFEIEYDKSCDNELYSGLQNLTLLLLRHHWQQFQHINYIDTLRYNNTILGCLSSMQGRTGSIIDKVPLSSNEVDNLLGSIIEEIRRAETSAIYTDLQLDKRMIVLNQYPVDYSSAAQQAIRQLCVNAFRYRYWIILLHDKNRGSSSIFGSHSDNSISIHVKDGAFFLDSRYQFRWHDAPSSLPEDLAELVNQTLCEVNTDNDYFHRISISTTLPRKGQRQLCDIPYGIAADGEIKRLSFDNELFATYVCGAAGSGKSTLLHTLINGFLQYHPDDIELWLIDFARVAFNRYIDPCPPHVRYILLENSPEIVLDIINELHKKLENRKRVFQLNHWEDISDVPPSQPMSSVIIIIDEFIELSNILIAADDPVVTGSNCRIKFEELFTEGRKHGFHFILSGQVFDEGIRGLTSTAKKQIQQRIVMKSDRSEIRAALDLSTPSDDDARLIENIVPHYTLTRGPIDIYGNRLQQAHVMIGQKATQQSWLDQLTKAYTPVRRYIPDDDTVYGDKQPVIVDGKCYFTFAAMQPTIKSELRASGTNPLQKAYLYIGTPLRMNHMIPIELTKDYHNNIMIVGNSSQSSQIQSIIMSSALSLELQMYYLPECFEFWTTSNNALSEIPKLLGQPIRTLYSRAEIHKRIQDLRNSLDCGTITSHFIVISGLDLLLQPSQQAMSTPKPLSENVEALWAMKKEKEQRPNVTASESSEQLRNDLLVLLDQGSIYGIHFIVHFQGVSAYSRCRIPDYFTHKLLFQMSREDAARIVPSVSSGYYAKLNESQFRYTNGLTRNTYRPYFHAGLSWDHKTMNEFGEIVGTKTEVNDDYLV